MYFHAIVKNKNTFDVVDHPYTTDVTISGTNIVVTYYATSALTTPLTATYAFANYYVYVIPKSEV